MEHVASADGTAIAVHRSGSGRPVVIVGGAFSTAPDASALAEALVAQGFEAVRFDRRARGDSGDTKPFAPEREAEDVAAVIEAVGGSAIVLGHSSGALLALLAAAHGAQDDGAPIEHLFLSEPPMRFGEDEPGADLPQRLQALVDEGRGGEAVTLFQLEGVGLPRPMVEEIKASPLFEHLARLAQSTVYDATIAAATSTPSERLLAVSVPTTVLVGVETMPVLERAAPMLVERMPSAELVRVPESRNHAIDPPATAAIIAARVAEA
ncbi:alpha/beta hydrolase [Agrococcus sp. ARC_14]|uniref:alpha/beta fold hydrolase n=1 Tax=Agrococcus sp. ARC_14 TaxID=2919927 RepID=UPI001F05ED78|nr:alpha/beta hydrolase [Agrococcus sp. ARC_14]MCH1881957.1 alpha/beta hydrolase [Agrococcus sp. ARC_14]